METRAVRILVIEDDPDILRLMLHVLTGAGCTAVPAYGGEDAFRKIAQQPPDLVVTDLAMPRMTGVEIIERIKRDETTKHIPCIAVTAFQWDQIASAAHQAGCEGFVTKPFTGAGLLKEVARFVPLSAAVGAGDR